MKNAMVIISILCLLLLCTGCKQSEFEFWADFSLSSAETGGAAIHAAVLGMCTAGKLTPEKCAAWDNAYPKFVESLKTARLAYQQYLEMKDKTTQEKVTVAIRNMKVYFDQINALMEAWKAK